MCDAGINCAAKSVLFAVAFHARKCFGAATPGQADRMVRIDPMAVAQRTQDERLKELDSMSIRRAPPGGPRLKRTRIHICMYR